MSKVASKGKQLNGPFNRRIGERMEQLGMTKLEEFADAFNLGRTTVYNMVLGRKSEHGTWVKPSVDTLVKLADALDTPLHQLIYELEPEARGAEDAHRLELIDQDVPPVRMVKVGVAGWVGAGPEQSEWCDETICVDEDFARGKDLIAFRIRGDSMQAGTHPIYDGDLVLVNRNDKGFDGASIVARLDDGYVCKLLKDDKFGKNLVSQNPRYTNGTPPIVPAERVREIVGRVVRIIHDEV